MQKSLIGALVLGVIILLAFGALVAIGSSLEPQQEEVRVDVTDQLID